MAWSKNAEDALGGQNISTTRISMERLEQSPIDWRAYLADDQIVLAPKKEVRPRQRDALDAVRSGLASGSAKVFRFDGQQVPQNAPFRFSEIASAQACLQKAALNQPFHSTSTCFRSPATGRSVGVMAVSTNTGVAKIIKRVLTA